MSLSNKDIKHIAKLARLTLTDSEIKKYRREISGIISYLEHIAEVNVAKVEATPTLTTVAQLRRDEAMLWPGDERQSTLAAASKKKNSYISVPRIFES